MRRDRPDRSHGLIRLVVAHLALRSAIGSYSFNDSLIEERDAVPEVCAFSPGGNRHDAAPHHIAQTAIGTPNDPRSRRCRD